MADQAGHRKEEGGSPAWIVTFADLMSLLLCFFVLLLSFSELDVKKFQAVAGSLRLAFGVQREVRARDIPKGTSIIAKEYSPGRPDRMTILDVMRQHTIDEDKQTLEFTDALVVSERNTNARDPTESANEKTKADAEKILEVLQQEIDAGMIQIEIANDSIIVRILERGSFPSGSAQLQSAFLPVIAKLRTVIAGIEGTVVVAGHTDDNPISTARYRSNWDLAAARAVSVVHELLADKVLDPARFVVEGHGETHPIVPNDSDVNRALNRRVELTIHQPPDKIGTAEELMRRFPADRDPDLDRLKTFRDEIEKSSDGAVSESSEN